MKKPGLKRPGFCQLDSRKTDPRCLGGYNYSLAWREFEVYFFSQFVGNLSERLSSPPD